MLESTLIRPRCDWASALLLEPLLALATRLPDDLCLGISRPGLALRSAIVPVPGVSRFGTLGAREAEAEEEAVVGSTDDAKRQPVSAGHDR